MYRQNYDVDCVTWSPAGRIFQMEYAMDAVKQGSCVVALRSKTHAVIVGLKRIASDLAYPSNKLVKIDDHIGVLATYMRNETLNHKFTHDVPMDVGRLAAKIGAKSQSNTQNGTGRPYGVGLLLVGVDQKGPHVYETCPSGNFYEYYSIAIGGRSQSAKTYLGKHFETFANCTEEELIEHGLRALNASVASKSGQELTLQNVSVGVVSADKAFNEITKDSLLTYLEKIKGDSNGEIEMEGATGAAAVSDDIDI